MARIIYKNKNEEKVPSVTTVLGIMDKPALKFWANKIGLQGIAVSQYVDDKAMIGTLAHYIIECYLKGEQPDFIGYKCDNDQIEQAKVCVKKFFEWESYQEQFEPVASELQLVSEKHQFGGTIDCIANLNGKTTLIDFKTCNAIYDEPYFQTSAYAELAREYGHDIEQIVILRIGRDETEGFEYIQIPNELPTLCFEVFKNCLGLYKSKKVFEKLKKSLEKEKVAA